MTIVRQLLPACLLALGLAALPALAKLPAPSPEAKTKADETAAKAAWSGKVDSYQLCQAQDRVAAQYRTSAAAAGKAVAAAPATPPCSDPGPFAYAAPEAKPLEASGAHSPADTAASPPAGSEPAATVKPAPKAP